jgi:hypothetical protein
MTILFTIFLVSFVMSIFIAAIGIIIYQYSFDTKTNGGGYDYNPNIAWLNSVIESGLPGQYVTNPPPELPHS